MPSCSIFAINFRQVFLRLRGAAGPGRSFLRQTSFDIKSPLEPLPPRNLPCYNSGVEVFFLSADRNIAKEITEGARQRKTHGKVSFLSNCKIVDHYGLTFIDSKRKFDALIVKCPGESDCHTPQFNVPLHTREDYIQYIQSRQLEKATVILKDISWLPQCPSLKDLVIIPSEQAAGNFDFSPLYEMPEIRSLECRTQYGEWDQFLNEIDYSRVPGLVNLVVEVNKGTKNFQNVETLKQLYTTRYRSPSRDVTQLFSSKELTCLSLFMSNIQSINGVEKAPELQCLELSYNRSLRDISALEKIKDTCRVLYIENCAKITDFTVLEEMENLEYLWLTGSNSLPDLRFLKKMKKLKTFILDMNVLDGDLTPCLDIPYVTCIRDRRHYNLKDSALPKGKIYRPEEELGLWR